MPAVDFWGQHPKKLANVTCKNIMYPNENTAYPNAIPQPENNPIAHGQALAEHPSDNGILCRHHETMRLWRHVYKVWLHIQASPVARSRLPCRNWLSRPQLCTTASTQ